MVCYNSIYFGFNNSSLHWTVLQIRSFEIQFENDSTSQPGLFLSGTTLTGVLSLNIIKPVSVVSKYNLSIYTHSV